MKTKELNEKAFEELPRPSFAYPEFVAAAHKQRGGMGISAFLASETPVLVGGYEAFITEQIDGFGRKEKYSEVPPTHWISDVNRGITDSWGDTIYSSTWFVVREVSRDYSL